MQKGRMFMASTQFTPVLLALSPSVQTRLEGLLPCQNKTYTVFPGFCDVHVHLREPGFSYKETVKTGTRAGAAGGYTALCSMPNLVPPPDSLPNLAPQLEAIQRDACVAVYPYGTITQGQKGQQLSDLEGLAPQVVAFSDDGKGVQDPEQMRQAMTRAKALGKIIAAHCEDESLLNGGYIHLGNYARTHGHRGICSASEYLPIRRDLELVRQTGCAYHVCHVSCAESVAAIRRAKKEGLNVTCETAPHYLIYTDADLQEDGRFKMNPPLRGEKDRQALLEGLADGTVDMIATDHAPHSAQEKARGLEGSPFGVVGLETAFAALYTHLVKPGILSLEALVDKMALAPRRRFGIPLGPEDLCVWDLETLQAVDPEGFHSLGKATPFAGAPLWGQCMLTLYGGRVVHHV